MWKKHFHEIVLKKGYEYFKEGAVLDFKIASSNIHAKIIDYNVTINLNDFSMYCDCRSKFCSHQSAALHYLDAHPQKDYSHFISSFTHGELVDFLNTELPENDELVNNLKIYKEFDVDLEFYQKKLENSFESYVNVIDFINVDLEKLKIAGQIDSLLTLLRKIVKYIDCLMDSGMHDEYEIIFDKIVAVIEDLIDLEYISEVSKFLEYFILNSEDEVICDNFAYIYSRFGDVDDN